MRSRRQDGKCGWNSFLSTVASQLVGKGRLCGKTAPAMHAARTGNRHAATHGPTPKGDCSASHVRLPKNPVRLRPTTEGPAVHIACASGATGTSGLLDSSAAHQPSPRERIQLGMARAKATPTPCHAEPHVPRCLAGDSAQTADGQAQTVKAPPAVDTILKRVVISKAKKSTATHSPAEPINVALRAHQTGVTRWPWQAAAADLHLWAERFIVEFKLETAVPALLIASLRGGRLGHFHYGRNGFGLTDEIALDEEHVRHSPPWRVYGTVLHELLHAWQQQHGTPGRRNYHNRQFRQKARTLGLIINHRGFTEYAAGESAFINILTKYGVSLAGFSATPSTTVSRPGSKLKLYQCPCGVKVRIGRSRFNAKCLDCDGVFVLQAPTLPQPSRSPVLWPPQPTHVPQNSTSPLLTSPSKQLHP